MCTNYSLSHSLAHSLRFSLLCFIVLVSRRDSASNQRKRKVEGAVKKEDAEGEGDDWAAGEVKRGRGGRPARVSNSKLMIEVVSQSAAS